MERDVGRPTIDTAFRVRTKAWFIAVSQMSKMSAKDLEVLFAPAWKQDSYRSGGRPRLWDKYRKGIICPKIEPDRHGRPSIVQRVETRFPGSREWIDMPFWRVLSYRPMEMSELKEIFLSLAAPVQNLIVMEDRPYHRMFWRRPINHEVLYDELAGIQSIDAATAVLALIKEAEVTQNQLQHQEGLKCWAICNLWLQKHPVLSKVLNDVNEIIEDKFTRISYAAEDGEYFSMNKSYVQSIIY